MNHQRSCGWAVVLLLGATLATGTAGVGVSMRGIATVSEQEVILDVVADTGGVALRSFGFTAEFDPAELTFLSGGRYAGLWFLRGEDGVNQVYTDVTQPATGTVRVVGGRLHGDHPGEGVAGEQILLATLVFKRQTGNAPQFALGLASPPPYESFVSADGDPLDEVVDIREVVAQAAAEDSDGDGLPDPYEIDTFGDLVTSDGSGDTDGDGDPDRDEWLCGTDPTDPASKFTVWVVPQTDGSKIVLWTGDLGRVYDLEWSGGLESFDLIGVGLPGLVPTVERIDALHNSNAKGFYRVTTKFPTLGR